MEAPVVKLQVIGCSHQQTPIEIRERLAFSPGQVVEALDRWRRAQPDVEAVLLSTCNRTELYMASESADLPAFDGVIDFIARFHSVEPIEVADYFYHHTKRAAAVHAFSVAAGLESMVVGESQILSQVKTGYEAACDRETTGPLTHALFQTAVKVARRVAEETAIQKRRVSIPSVAVAEFASRIFERFDDKRTLVIGAGEMADETLRYLKDEGTRLITVVNRSLENAKRLAEQFGGETAAWEGLDDQLARADLIISTTGATETVVDAERFRQIQPRRGGGPLFILDLAVPRDFDPAVGDFSDVYLYSIDDLQATCEENRRHRDREIPAARKIVDQEAKEFTGDVRHRKTGPIIRQLQADWRAAKDEEVQRLMKKLPELDDRDRNEIERSFDRLIGRLLHPPLESLRDESHEDEQQRGHSLLDALTRLFQLRND